MQYIGISLRHVQTYGRNHQDKKKKSFSPTIIDFFGLRDTCSLWRHTSQLRFTVIVLKWPSDCCHPPPQSLDPDLDWVLRNLTETLFKRRRGGRGVVTSDWLTMRSADPPALAGKYISALRNCNQGFMEWRRLCQLSHFRQRLWIKINQQGNGFGWCVRWLPAAESTWKWKQHHLLHTHTHTPRKIKNWTNAFLIHKH